MESIARVHARRPCVIVVTSTVGAICPMRFATTMPGAALTTRAEPDFATNALFLTSDSLAVRR